LSKCIELNPKLDKAYLLRGKCKFASKEVKQSILDFNSATKINPTNGEAYFCLGYAILKTDTSKVTIEPFSAAIANGYEDYQVYYQRAVVRSLKKDFTNAIFDYNKAIEKKPNFALAFYDRGYAKLQTKDFSTALVDFQQASYLDTSIVEAYINQGYCFMMNNDYVNANKSLSKAISYSSSNVMALNNRGVASFKTGDFKSSLTDLGQGLKIEKNNYKILNNIGVAQTKVKNTKVANDAFNLAISSNPQSPEPYLNRGFLKESAGDIKGACADWTIASKLGNAAAAEYIKECK